jgi:hypothetical protein
VFFWNQRVRKNNGMKETSMIRNDVASTVTKAIAVNVMNNKPAIISLPPESRSSFRESISDVCLAITRPEVYVSWNSIDNL